MERSESRRARKQKCKSDEKRNWKKTLWAILISVLAFILVIMAIIFASYTIAFFRNNPACDVNNNNVGKIKSFAVGTMAVALACLVCVLGFVITQFLKVHRRRLEKKILRQQKREERKKQRKPTKKEELGIESEGEKEVSTVTESTSTPITSPPVTTENETEEEKSENVTEKKETKEKKVRFFEQVEKEDEKRNKIFIDENKHENLNLLQDNKIHEFPSSTISEIFQPYNNNKLDQNQKKNQHFLNFNKHRLSNNTQETLESITSDKFNVPEILASLALPE